MHVKGDSSAQTGQTCNVILCLVIAIVVELVDLQTRQKPVFALHAILSNSWYSSSLNLFSRNYLVIIGPNN